MDNWDSAFRAPTVMGGATWSAFGEWVCRWVGDPPGLRTGTREGRGLGWLGGRGGRGAGAGDREWGVKRKASENRRFSEAFVSRSDFGDPGGIYL